MNTRYDQIIDIQQIACAQEAEDIPAVLSLAQHERILPATADQKRTLLLAIDVQNDFMEDIGSLAVAGSKGDVKRLTQWMYTNLEALTQVTCSLDYHSMIQIFHPGWWLDKNGRQPVPFTSIRYEDVVNGIWTVAHEDNTRSLEYLHNLEAGGKKQLCIWPYHCLEGTVGAKLESQFTRMLYFHAAVRQTKPTLVYKGQDPYTEMYGIIKGEYDPSGYVNRAVLDMILDFDAIYIAGEASSHCVLASTEQILEHFAADRSVTSRITLLADCMSPITGFEESTVQQFAALKERYGIQVRQSTDVLL